MEQRTFIVPNIGCSGCVSTIVNELSQKDGVLRVAGDVDTKRVSVEWQAPMTWDGIVTTLENIEYAPLEEEPS
jgi:copper chaperone CopZ